MASKMRCPELPEVQKLSEDLGFQCTKDELLVIQASMQKTATQLERLSELPVTRPPVKYPRSPGQRPPPHSNPHNAWAWRCDVEGAGQGPLRGRRVGVKDCVCLAGVPMSCGSRLLEGFVPDIDATIVTRILDAGGRIVGKTSCEALCLGGSSCTFAHGPVTNPHDVTRSAGGSSSGSAVAVQTGDADMAVGGDQGGSIRIPASLCGIVGLKPTFGLVPYTGVMAVEITLDHVGPMARNVTDCALLLELNDNVRGLKVALVTEGFDACVDDNVRHVTRRAVQSLTQAGVSVSEVSIPLHKDGTAVWGAIAKQGLYNCMIRGNGTGSFWKGSYDSSLQGALHQGLTTLQSHLSLVLKAACITGEFLNRHYGNVFYGRGQNLAAALTEAYDSALDRYDALAMPTLPMTAPKLPANDASPQEIMQRCTEMNVNTAPFDVTGHPALSINAGWSCDLPVGLMLVGRRDQDLTVLQLARALEKIQDGQVIKG